MLDIQIDPAAERALVPSLILQPVIENAIKYAVASNEDGCRIAIRGLVNGEWLELELTDNGPGSPSFAPGAAEPSGVGLRNTRERLGDLVRRAPAPCRRESAGGWCAGADYLAVRGGLPRRPSSERQVRDSGGLGAGALCRLCGQFQATGIRSPQLRCAPVIAPQPPVPSPASAFGPATR